MFRPLALAALLASTAGVHAAAQEQVQRAGPDCEALVDGNDGAACVLARTLESDFIFPEAGARYAAMLRAAIAEGRYRGLASEDAARRMTADLQAVAPDGHLRVQPAPERGEGGARNFASDIPLLEQGDWIAPGIGYLRINEFTRDPATIAEVSRFMADHADAEALIFDLRTHHGGGLEEMDAILEWLFAEPTPLVRMEMRRSVADEHGVPEEELATLRRIETPDMATAEHWALPNGDSRLWDARVILLTGPRTASAAEHFALAMKATGRATLIGSATAGANHFGGGMDLPGGLAAFIPIGRTYDPATGEDWEGHGVQPDIATDPADALARALIELGVEPAESARLARVYAPTLPMTRREG
ncbi:S41 family peptidase [Aurantiacibacter spongiae]|nr:S41 family peptidase [Aurantiacibacter spongiae]